MKKNNTIRVKNELPELLEAVCSHDDCPNWLKDAIWDAFNQKDVYVSFAASWWRHQLESMVPEPADDDAQERYLPKDFLDSEVIHEQ